MNKLKAINVSRRAFLASAPALWVGYHLLEPSGDLPFTQQYDLKEELTPEELKKISQSSLAGYVQNFFGDAYDYSCAESFLLAFLRQHKKPENLVWAAAGFGGGLGQRDLCGFLTGGIMSIGLAAGDLKLERKAAKSWCGDKVRAYWKWWQKTAPQHCKDILKIADGRNVCTRMGLLAAVELERLLEIDR